MNTKDTNPKDAVGTKKVPASTVPQAVMAEVGLAMLEGARKYGRHNYRMAGVRASVYVDAVFRHLMLEFWDAGMDVDPDSGLHPVTKAIASLVVLRDSMLLGNWVDDRPPSLPKHLLTEMNAKAAEIIKKYPDAKPAFTIADTANEHQLKPLTPEERDNYLNGKWQPSDVISPAPRFPMKPLFDGKVRLFSHDELANGDPDPQCNHAPPGYFCHKCNVRVADTKPRSKEES